MIANDLLISLFPLLILGVVDLSDGNQSEGATRRECGGVKEGPRRGHTLSGWTDLIRGLDKNVY